MRCITRAAAGVVCLFDQGHTLISKDFRTYSLIVPGVCVKIPLPQGWRTELKCDTTTKLTRCSLFHWYRLVDFLSWTTFSKLESLHMQVMPMYIYLCKLCLCTFTLLWLFILYWQLFYRWPQQFLSKMFVGRWKSWKLCLDTNILSSFMMLVRMIWMST